LREIGNDRKSINFYSYVYNWVCRSSIDGGIMSKVLHMIDFEHLMDYEQYRRFDAMLEKDMREESYVNPDGLLEEEPLHSDNDDVDFDDPFRKHITSKVEYDDIPF